MGDARGSVWSMAALKPVRRPFRSSAPGALHAMTLDDRHRARPHRPLRCVRRPLRPRGARRRARRTDRRVPRAQADPTFRAELEPAAARLHRPALAAHRRAASSARTPAARGSCSSARTSTTPARTRSTTCSARRCSPSGMGKKRVIAETGAGQHGVATATAAALLGLECTVYMGEEDTRRQALNVARMRLLGAEVVPVTDRLAHAQGRDQRGDARLGRPTSTRRTTCSAPSPARTRSR